jgi:phosphoglycerate dehydrogenase-like enzyme
VTARAFWDNGQAAEEMLLAEGFHVEHSPVAGPYADQDLAPLLSSYNAVIAGTDAYTADLFAACPALRVVSRWGIGIDSVDLEAATRAGVAVTNTPGTTTEAVADYAFALLLGIARRLAEGDALMRAGGWGEYPGTLVLGKTLGLVGFGQIGQAVARRAAGFAMRILVHDPMLEREADRWPEVQFVALDELLAEADFVSLHAAVTSETRRMIGAPQLARMKPTAYLVNTARGALIDDEALLAALEAGAIAGAAMDVYAQEPLPTDHPLRGAPRCLLTPHNAFNAVEAARATSMRAAENIVLLWRGERTASVCNPAVLESPSLRLAVR